MLDDILEIVFEIILDGTIEAASSKKVPLPIRILLSAIIILIVLLYIGLSVLMLYIGIQSKSNGLIVLAFALLLGIMFITLHKIKKRNS